MNFGASYALPYFPELDEADTASECRNRLFAAQAVSLALAKPDHDPTLTLDEKGVCVNYASGGAGILDLSSTGPVSSLFIAT